MGGQMNFGRGLHAYRVVKDRLVQTLASLHNRAGSSLPAEKQLAEEHGVSIGTLRNAVDSLGSEGILIRQQGKGTFVSQHDNQRLLYYYFHIVPQGQQKVRPTTKLLRFQRARAGEEAAERLRIGVSSWVFKIRNLLLIQTKPVIVDEIVIDATRFDGLTAKQFESRPGSIYQLYESDFGQTVVRASERLRACSASGDHSTPLDVEANYPLLQIRRVAYGFRDDPIEWRVSYVNTSEHEYFSELNS